MTREEFINRFESLMMLTKNDIYELGQLYDEVIPHWTSVKEDLPKEGEKVYAYNGTFNEVHLCNFVLGVFEDPFGPFEEGTITHWMSIPELPKEQ